MKNSVSGVFDLFKPKCPKCDSKRLKTVKENIFAQSRRLTTNLIFPIMFLFNKGPKDLVVCQDCGFSWEKR